VQAEVGPDAVVSSRLLPVSDDAAPEAPSRADKKEASEVASAT
jgi:hypothetical protein